MKKLFFFRSSFSNNGSNHAVSSQSTDKPLNDTQGIRDGAGLRRSRSYSSGSFLVEGLSSSGNGVPQQLPTRTLRRSDTPERRAKSTRCDRGTIPIARDLERQCSSSSSMSRPDSSANSSSSNMSSKVLDRYIDGEQQQERSKTKNSSLQRHNTANGRLPPRFQFTAPTSPTNSIKDRPKSHSFREGNTIPHHLSSKDLTDNRFNLDSPRKVAKNVIERLSQAHAFRKSSSDFDRDFPITIEDIYGGSVNVCYNSAFDVLECKPSSPEEQYDSHEKFSDVQFEGVSDVELRQRSREAQERFVLLSEELEQQSFLQDSWFDMPIMPSFIESFRKINEDRVSLAIEVSRLLKSQIADRDFAKREIRSARTELESHCRRLEKEKNELQSILEKELDRRSSEWSLKLEKFQSEEQRLRDRVRELAEHNVELQREASSFNERETENQNIRTHAEQQVSLLASNLDALNEENRELRQNLSQLQEKHTAAEENYDRLKRSFQEKDKECKELQKSITRLARNCSDQQKTIEGFRERFSEETEKQLSSNRSDEQVAKLQLEQMRLTGVELALRREVESLRLEVDLFRHENIMLLNRLKDNGKEVEALTFKLDKEMWNRICCLENQGLPMLRECTQLSSKLLEHVKGIVGQQGTSVGLEAQFVVESEVKVQGFKRGTESLTRSLQTISSLLQEKSNLVSKYQSLGVKDEGDPNPKTSEKTTRFELGAETLLTSLLRERLYSKELEVEQLQAELAAAVRGNDILKCGVQNALDNLSCTTYKLKDVELQMLNKDENIRRLQSDLDESIKELTVIHGILPKVSEERDMMWEKVKQCAEKNMLLNSEVDILKRKVETLDEDILLKEGQITILKDSLGTRTFDLLISPDHT